MNNSETDQKLQFIFETGRAFRFYMDERTMDNGPEVVAACEALALSSHQLRLALQVWLHQPMNLRELAARLHLAPSTVSLQVDKLVENDILTREPDPADRRRIILNTHPRCAKAMNDINQCFLEGFLSVAREVSPESLDRWFLVMQEIHAILEQKNAHA